MINFVSFMFKNFINAFDANTINELTNGMTEICDFITNPAFLGVIAAAGIVYAVILCVNFSKADSADKRKDALKRLYSAIFGLVIILLIIILMKIYVNNATNIASWINSIFFEQTTTSGAGGGETGGGSTNTNTFW